MGQITLSGIRKPGKEQVADQETKKRVAKKFQPLIVKVALNFVGA